MLVILTSTKKALFAKCVLIFPNSSNSGKKGIHSWLQLVEGIFHKTLLMKKSQFELNYYCEYGNWHKEAVVQWYVVEA